MAFGKIAEVYVEIKGDKGKFSRTIRGAKRETAGFASSATKNIGNVTRSLRRLATVAGAVAAIAIGVKLTKAVIRLGIAAVSSAVRLDRLKIGLAAVAGGSKEAERQLQRLEKVAKLPGLSFEGAIAGSTALQAAGISAELSERSLLAFGNALVTVGKGAADLQGVNLALSQIATGTQGFGQEIRQLQQRLPQVRVAMMKAFGTATAEDFKELGISGRDFIEGIVIEFEKLPKVIGTVANDLENVGIAFERLRASIGQKLLGITSDVAKSLESVIEGLRVVVENYENYRDEAAQVFREVAIIGITLTGQMVGGMASIMSKLAKIVWVPLKFEILKTMQDVNDAVEIGIIKMMGTIREFFGGSAEIARLQKETVETSRVEWNMLFKTIQQADIDTAIRTGIDGIITDFDSMFTKFMTGLVGMKKATDDFAKKIPKVELGETPKSDFVEAVKRMLAIRNKLLKTRQKDVDFLKPAVDPMRQAERVAEAAERIRDTRKLVDDDMKKRQRTGLADFSAFLEERRQRAEAVAAAIRPAFENLFEDFFSGRTKSLWEAFWNDLKRIAIRQIAGIFATQLLASFITGGVSSGIGIGASLSGLIPQPTSTPASRAVGGAIGRGARAVGNFLEGGTIVVNDQNLDNFDTQRMTKQVQRAIAPAMASAAADGIGIPG